MTPKQRSILLLIGIFFLGILSGYFGRGLYDQYRWKVHRESRNQTEGKSRFVGYFLSVIQPEPSQIGSVEAILEKWDLTMKNLKARFESESQVEFEGMVDELNPYLKAKQLQLLKEALERFGPHRLHQRKKK